MTKQSSQCLHILNYGTAGTAVEVARRQRVVEHENNATNIGNNLRDKRRLN